VTRAFVAPCVLFAVSLAFGCATVKPEVVHSAAPLRRPDVSIDPSNVSVDAVKFVGDEQYAWFDGNTGRALTFDDVLARLRASKAVVVGEQHDQPAHHELERRVVAALTQGQPKAVVGVEMLTWNLQPPLDQFNRGEIDADALAGAVDWPKAWGFPFEMYKPIFVDGHKSGARFIALNAPRELVKAVRKKGVTGLSSSELKELPDLDLGDKAHREWFHAIFSGGGHTPANDSDVDSFYTAQVVWDESMAQTAAAALDAGASQVIVIAGIGHVARGRGIPQRIERRVPDVHVISIVPVTDVDSESAEEKLKEAVVAGEAEILVIPKFEEELSL
jgi:uncharacterized iron-regulated protein